MDQLAAHERCEEPGPGPGEEDAIATGRESRLRFHPAEELDDLLGLAGVVALVVLPAGLAIRDHHRLDGGGADVDADEFHARRGALHTRRGALPLPTVVARLTARSSLPPPETENRIARAKPALGACHRLRQLVPHRGRPIFVATCRTILAAVPAARPSCGT